MQSLIKLRALLTRQSIRVKYFVKDGIIQAISIKFHVSRSEKFRNPLGLEEVQLTGLAVGDVVIPLNHIGRK